MIFYSTLLPWYMKNYQNYGRWTLSTIGDMGIFSSFAPEVLMVKSDPKLMVKVEIKERLKLFENEMWNDVKGKYGWNDDNPSKVFHQDPARSSILKEEAMKVIKRNFHIFIISHVLNTGRVLLPYHPYFYKFIGNDVRIVSILSFVADYFIMMLSALGVMFFLKKKFNGKYYKVIIFSFMLLIFYFSFIPGIEGYSRFRIPILPYISIFAAFGLWEIVTLYKSKKKLDIHAE